ncbi:hypothetical protein [Pseudofrankia sp. BMG5.36]|uniref:hypothetical protein n=1 Tax=Pseudofrankia sp. BMG5.36 TaxID=1834512 RepID=UPI0008DA4C22|nr:hypothetical protein [Pseudofrankia sp. BMG5.36]OHV52979.1 hypothetical protein BCD48_44820 [Pseudofrankia sp. BMG5.36]
MGISASTTATLAQFNDPTRVALVAAAATSALTGADVAVVVIGRPARTARRGPAPDTGPSRRR